MEEENRRFSATDDLEFLGVPLRTGRLQNDVWRMFLKATDHWTDDMHLMSCVWVCMAAKPLAIERRLRTDLEALLEERLEWPEKEQIEGDLWTTCLELGATIADAWMETMPVDRQAVEDETEGQKKTSQS